MITIVRQGGNIGPFISVDHVNAEGGAMDPDRLRCLRASSHAREDYCYTVLGEFELSSEAADMPVPVLRSVESLSAEIDLERDRRFYSNIEAAFPAGTKSIQLRDERDRANLANVIQGAMILVQTGQGETPLSYITEDNETQQVPAADFLAIGLAVMAAKQAIVHAARAKKDALAGLTQAQLNAYDVTAGWPA